MTAASVYQATGKPVVVAFDAGNLKAVSEKLLNVLPENVPVYFAVGQDSSQTGLHKAKPTPKCGASAPKFFCLNLVINNH